MEQTLPRERPNLFPQTSGEMVTTIAHYYRGELVRMAGWRDRIDRTSNWAITVVAAMLSLSLSTVGSHHGVILFAMLLISLLLWIEARRYRFFDVYRSRVRLLERSYFAQVLAPGPDVGGEWLEELARGLRKPRFHVSPMEAVSRRLRRNYFWMYLILLLAWALKISSPKLQNENIVRDTGHPIGDIVANAGLGPLPGWLVLSGVGLFLAGVLFMTFRVKADDGELAHGEVHV